LAISTNTRRAGRTSARRSTGFGTVGNVADLRLMLVGGVVGTAGTNAGTLTGSASFTHRGLRWPMLTNTFISEATHRK